jgi:prepilin-type N-terminal cleavage/methylation domain-containing protein
MNRKGFTLIELLIVIAIIGFLAAAILVAVDPVRRIQESRDARRQEEVYSILNAILNKQVDDRATFDGDDTSVTPAPIITHATDAQVIVRSHASIDCDAGSAASRPGCEKALNLSGNSTCVADLSDTSTPAISIAPEYISELPIDPRDPLGGNNVTICPTGSSGCGTIGDIPLGDQNTGYYVLRTAGSSTSFRLEVGACGPERADSISVKR